MSLHGSLPAEQVDNAVINLPTRGNVNNIKHRILEIDFHNSRSHRQHTTWRRMALSQVSQHHLATSLCVKFIICVRAQTTLVIPRLMHFPGGHCFCFHLFLSLYNRDVSKRRQCNESFEQIFRLLSVLWVFYSNSPLNCNGMNEHTFCCMQNVCKIFACVHKYLSLMLNS